MSEQDSIGYLTVRVSTASGAIPVEGVTVVIQGKDEDNQNVFFSLSTDRSGTTQRVALPAPSKNLSAAPSPPSRPYSTYTVDVYRQGYYPQHYNGVPIFEGITAVQNARIIPIAEFDAQDPFYTPSQSFNEYENTNL